MTADDTPWQEYNDAAYFALLALGDLTKALDDLITITEKSHLEGEGIRYDYHAAMRVSHNSRTTILMAAFDLEARIGSALQAVLGDVAAKKLEYLSLGNKLDFVALCCVGEEPPGHIDRAFTELKDWRDDFAHGRYPEFPNSFRGKKQRRRKVTEIATPGPEVEETIHLLKGYIAVIDYLNHVLLRDMERGPEGNAGVFAEALAILGRYQFDEQGRIKRRRAPEKERERPSRSDRFGMLWDAINS